MKKGYIIFIIINLIVLNCFFASSKVVIGDLEINNGLLIEPVVIDYLKTGSGYDFNIHVFNKSNGVPITSGLSCYFHLYNSSGNHLLVLETSTIEHIFDYSFYVDGGNFSRGIYEVKFSCNNSVLGGSSELTFEVNPLGNETKTSESILYVVLTIAVLILFLMVLYLNIRIPSRNKTNGEGKIIFISNWKYLKIGMVLITYSLGLWLLNLLVGLSDNFLSLSIYYGLFSFLFLILVKLSWVVFVLVFVIFMASLIHDRFLKKELTKFGVIRT